MTTYYPTLTFVLHKYIKVSRWTLRGLDDQAQLLATFTSFKGRTLYKDIENCLNLKYNTFGFYFNKLNVIVGDQKYSI